MRAFYIHYNRDKGMARSTKGARLYRGFTAFIQPDPNNAKNVLYSVTYCSAKDQFSKKIGRAKVQEMIPDSVNKRIVPRLLAQEMSKCFDRNTEIPEEVFFYTFKYML